MRWQDDSGLATKIYAPMNEVDKLSKMLVFIGNANARPKSVTKLKQSDSVGMPKDGK